MRVLIVDDHTLVRAGIRRLLEGFEGVEVAGEAGSAQEALDLAWFTPSEAASARITAEMTGGQDRLLRLALAHVGELP